MREAKRPPDPEHPLGYGRVAYFWAFLVAVMLFTLGGIFSIYEGMHKLHAPEPMARPWIAIAVLVMLYMLGFTNVVLRNSLGIMAPAISQDMALSPETLSVIASSFFFAYGLMQIPGGMLLDRFGARRTLAFLLLFTTAGAALFSMAENTSQLILARVLMGIGCAGIFSGAFFVINQHVAPERVITQTALLNSFAAVGGLCATAPLAACTANCRWPVL